MTKDKYVLGKHSGSKQIVYHSYDYNGHTIMYRASVPYKEGAPKSYYVGLVDKQMAKLKANGKLKKYSEAYIRKMVWLTRRKKVAIGIGAGVLVLIGAAAALVITLIPHYKYDNVVFDSETLLVDKESVTLNRDINLNFTVNDFYTPYGYTLPDTLNQVTVNGVNLTPEQYEYSNGHLKIGAEFATGKVYIAAEANYVHFEDDSWENIIKYANKGLSELYIRYGRKTVVGETHDLEMENGQKLKARVIGEGHDRLVKEGVPTNKAATLTLEITNLINQHEYNETSSTDYINSDLRNYCNGVIGQFSEPLRTEIKEVDKYTTTYASTEEPQPHTTEKVFPLSLREIGGDDLSIDSSATYVLEESPYQYYQEPNVELLNQKRNKTGAYWLRTVDHSNDNKALYVDFDGKTSTDGTSFNSYPASENMGVSVAFAIGETESFITDSWANVASYSIKGLSALQKRYGPNTFVGLERKIVNSSDPNKNELPVRVIGEKHDALANYQDKVATLTFEYVANFNTLTFSSIEREPGESFTGSLIESTLNNSVYYGLPEEMRWAIPLVRKTTATYAKEDEVISGVEATENYVFPLSLREAGDIYYVLAEPYSLEEKTYDYYRVSVDPKDVTGALALLNNLRLKNGGYWLRSSYCQGEGYRAHIVDEYGRTTYANFEAPTIRNTHEPYACAPAFSLGFDDKPINFENDSWKNLCYNASFGLDHLKKVYDMRSFIGASKDIVLNEGTALEEVKHVRVIGEEADTTSSGKTTTLTFEFTTPIDKVKVSDDQSTAPIYSTSIVRDYCNNVAIKTLPNALQDYIKEVKKKTVVYEGEGQYAIEETNDKLFPLSVNEINDNYEGYDAEQVKFYTQENTTYYYYIGVKDFIRAKASDIYYSSYWLRSPSLTQGHPPYNSGLVNYVNRLGYIQIDPGTRAFGVAPAFAI